MKYFLIIALICVVFCPASNCAGHSMPVPQLLLPFYVYPSWWDQDAYLWDDVARASALMSVITIINPNNGPDGCPPNSDYQQGLADLQAANVMMIGYVSTQYAVRSITDVFSDIDEYFTCYHVGGIMFDEVSSYQHAVPYYQALHDYITQYHPNATIVLNFGTEPHEEYMIFDSSVFGIFEGTAEDFLGFSAPPWLPNEQTLVFIYDTPSEDLQEVLNTLQSQNIGFYFITDDILPNPWDTLPPYFEDEIIPIPEPKTAYLFGLFLVVLFQQQYVPKNPHHPG